MQTEIHTLIEDRFSPRNFTEAPVSEARLRTLLEAARWAPSSFNEQPWAFIVARREDEDEFDRMACCLTEGNREWATDVPVLMVSLAKQHFSGSGKPNRHALHDVGLATAQLILQAESLGLAVHCMAGFDQDCVRSTYNVPDEWVPVAAIAVGYPAQEEPEERRRKPLEDFVFGGGFRRPAPFVEGD